MSNPNIQKFITESGMGVDYAFYSTPAAALPQKHTIKKETIFNHNNDSMQPKPEKERETGQKLDWSEGSNRKISTVVINKRVPLYSTVAQELSDIGEKVGFNVEISYMSPKGSIWLEDYSIRRADGKTYILPKVEKKIKIPCQSKYVQETKRNSSLSNEYASLFDEKDIIRGKSYLEGGNVLNTVLKNGKSGAIIGENSIDYSLKAMNLEKTPENISIVINQMGEDLGIKPENITFIPQFDFHIDMFYRPLEDGTIAVPDYEKAMDILKNTKIKDMNRIEKIALINRLSEISDYTLELRDLINKKLEKDGYTIKPIPCFSLIYDNLDKLPDINYQNAICGTSKDGKTYIILNKSAYPELNDEITQYYKNAGIEEVYFVSTQRYLRCAGGIDCLTQER